MPAAAPAIAGTPVVVPSAPVVPATVSAGGWRWPTQGQLIGRFSAGDPKRQGIDIAGTAGQAVVAAADGVVVYSGAGLVGYGELIIVKHSDEWLSAYAHSRKRLVSEGTPVRAGQPIAELGRSGTSRDMLHFEVRRNGKPVDPLQVLPPPRRRPAEPFAEPGRGRRDQPGAGRRPRPCGLRSASTLKVRAAAALSITSMPMPRVQQGGHGRGGREFLPRAGAQQHQRRLEFEQGQQVGRACRSAAEVGRQSWTMTLGVSRKLRGDGFLVHQHAGLLAPRST